MKFIVYLFRGIGIAAAVSLFLLGLAVMFYTLGEGLHVVESILGFSTAEGRVIYHAMGCFHCL